MAEKEIEWIERVKAGDASAFTELDEKWRPILLGWIVRKVGNAADADDLSQKTLFMVWQKHRLFNPDAGTFKSWICRIANNFMVDTIRSAKRKIRGGDFQHEPLADYQTIRSQSDFEEEIAEREIRDNVVQTVREVILELPRPLRQACNGYLTGKKITAVGDTLALSKTTVAVRLTACRLRMRDNERLMKIMGETVKVAPLAVYDNPEVIASKKQLTLF